MGAILKGRKLDVFLELLRNSGASDREIAKKVSASQPTVTRIRNRLFNEGFIEKYSLQPGVEKLGLKFMVLTFFGDMDFKSRKLFRELIKNSGEVVFSAEGEGLKDYSFVVLSLHPDFDFYQSFLGGLRKRLGARSLNASSFFVSRKSLIKGFDFSSAVESFVLPRKRKRDKISGQIQKIPFVKKPQN